MSWSIGYDANWRRDIGYGVPSVCDYPSCNAKIHRGLSYVCGGEPYGGDRGCGLYFCTAHLISSARLPQLCSRCRRNRSNPFKPTADLPEWNNHKLTDESWKEWRKAYPEEIKRLKTQ